MLTHFNFYFSTLKMLLFSLLAMTLLSPRTLSKPLDVNDRITTLLNNNIATSLQDKAEAIDTILRLLSEIDLVSICETVMMEKPNVGTNMDNIISQAAKERAFEFMLTDKLMQAENVPFPDFNMNTNEILPVNFPLKTSAVPMKSSSVPRDHKTPSDDGMSTRVVIDKVQSLKPNVTLSAEARRLDSQEIRRLQRPELVGFKLVPSEHYMSELEGARSQTEGIEGGTQVHVQSMVEGTVNYARVNGTEAAMDSIAESDINETANSNVTDDDSTTISPASSTSRMSSTTTISSTNATMTSTNDSISSSDNDTISSINDTSSSNDISSTTISLSSNETISSTDDTILLNNDTTVSTNDTMSSKTASASSTTKFEEEVESTTTRISASSTFEELFDTTTSNEIVEEVLNVSLSNISTVETTDDTSNTTTSPKDFTNETQIINATESSTTHLSEEVMTELRNDTMDVVLTNQTITANGSSSYNETETVYEELELSTGNPTEATAVTDIYEHDTLSQNDTEQTVLETASMEVTSNNDTTSTATVAETASSTTTIASSLNLTEEATLTTIANNIELSTQDTDEESTDYATNYADNSEEAASTTVDYFWTPGSTLPHQNLYDYDYPSSAEQDVESRDNTIEDSVDVRGSNAVQNDTVDVTTDSTSVTQSEYDYIYNLLGMLGDNRQLPTYNRYEDSKYDETNNYAGYDVNNLEYTSDDVTDYSIDALKTSTKFLTNDHYNNDGNKKQGINMLASIDSPANTAAEDDFMLSAQPGYYNSLADQTSWKMKDNEYKENSVSNDKDYDKRFTAHSQDSKSGVTSAIASSIGVQQKTVWSEPTLPQMLYHPNGYACPGLFGYYADIADCQAFFICSWGMPYRFLCPPGTLWNTAETVCDWANNVTCNRKK